jgi:hypothetical protein
MFRKSGFNQYLKTLSSLSKMIEKWYKWINRRKPVNNKVER